jgi:hypothetical protein
MLLAGRQDTRLALPDDLSSNVNGAASRVAPIARQKLPLNQELHAVYLHNQRSEIGHALSL